MSQKPAWKRHLVRRWVCQVVRTGYHNGAGCHSSEPHHDDEWGCGYRWELSLPDTAETRRLLRVRKNGA